MFCEIFLYIFKCYKFVWVLLIEIVVVVWGLVREGCIIVNIVFIVYIVIDFVFVWFWFGWYICLWNGGRSCWKKYCCVFICMYKWSGGYRIFFF